jgi:hypothetical protein
MTRRLDDGSRRLNDGSRRSRLELAESTDGSAEWRALQAEIAATPVPPFDFDAITARAFTVSDPPPPSLDLGAPASARSQPSRRSAVRWFGVALAAAAALLVMLKLPGDPEGNRVKGEVDLGFYVLRDGAPYPGDPSLPVRSGDRLQFTYMSGAADRMVLVGLDGTGRAQTFYPDDGDPPVLITPGQRHVLPGSILLDDAEGPEVFVAGFGDAGLDAAAVRSEAEATWREGGVDGLKAWAEREPAIAILVLEKD